MGTLVFRPGAEQALATKPITSSSSCRSRDQDSSDRRLERCGTIIGSVSALVWPKTCRASLRRWSCLRCEALGEGKCRQRAVLPGRSPSWGSSRGPTRTGRLQSSSPTSPFLRVHPTALVDFGDDVTGDLKGSKPGGHSGIDSDLQQALLNFRGRQSDC